jgi:hypothetical protein
VFEAPPGKCDNPVIRAKIYPDVDRRVHLGAGSKQRRACLVNGTEVAPTSVLPDEPARFREDAALPLLDVHGTELDRAGGVEEPAVMRFQDGEADPPQRRVKAEGPRTA